MQPLACVKKCAMVPLRVSQCTEFALRYQRIFALDMHLVSKICWSGTSQGAQKARTIRGTGI